MGSNNKPEQLLRRELAIEMECNQLFEEAGYPYVKIKHQTYSWSEDDEGISSEATTMLYSIDKERYLNLPEEEKKELHRLSDVIVKMVLDKYGNVSDFKGRRLTDES